MDNVMETMRARVRELMKPNKETGKAKETQKDLAKKIGISESWLSGKMKDKDFSIYDLAMLSKYYGVSADWLLGLTDSDPDTEIDSLSLHDLARILARLWKLSYIDVFEDMGEDEDPRGLCVYFPYDEKSLPEIRCEADLLRKIETEQEEDDIADLVNSETYDQARAFSNKTLGRFLIAITEALDALVENPAMNSEIMEHIINGELIRVPTNRLDYLKNDVLGTLVKMLPDLVNRTKRRAGKR